MEGSEHRYNPMQIIKRRFFAMRNGVIADVLRRAGSPYKVIFGLNLPQIVEIANESTPSRELAEALWANNTTRESILLAPMIMPRDVFTEADALRWVDTVPDQEAADILCHRLLRYMPYACKLADSLTEGEGMSLYTGIRLAVNFVYQHPEEAFAIANKVLGRQDSGTCKRLATQIISEVKELNLL